MSHSFPYHQDNAQIYLDLISSLYTFKVEGYSSVLGYLLPSTVEAFPWTDSWKIDTPARIVTLRNVGNDAAQRSRSMDELLNIARERDIFRVFKGWRNELYPIYGPNKEVLLDIERSASPLFGVVTFGVHMTAYVRSKEGLKIWVPRRAENKQTYGGMLDNTVAGGISSGEEPFECLVREAAEEASLPEDLVRKGARAAGTVTYILIRDERAGGETGLLQPECEYAYDLELGEDVVPKPADNEVQGFYLWTVEEVQAALARGEFKANCALVMIDFFIRHGILTPANEKDYIEIIARLHRRLEFPVA